VVRGDLARLTPCRPRSTMSRTGGAPGQVTSTVTLGDLPGAPHDVHLSSPQNRAVVFMDSGGSRRARSWHWVVGFDGRESGTRGDLHTSLAECGADRPGPELLLLSLAVLADQRNGLSHSARGADMCPPSPDLMGPVTRLSDTLALSNQLRHPHPSALPTSCLPGHHSMIVTA